ncbi:hypothetical protein J9246_06570 [Micrococcus luteus]|nr:hypothetical protein [Micrococcus luteus]MBS9537475.1 hypothetical protein [Micrococcus luteus]
MTDLLPEHIFDPELVIPDPAAKGDPRFWFRLNEWATAYRPKVGRATMEAVANLLSDPPESRILPPSEFYRVIQKISLYPEADPAPGQPCATDVEAISNLYTPFWGSAHNCKLLTRDLLDLPPESVTLLASEKACWPSDAEQEISAFGKRVLVLHSLADAAVLARLELKKQHFTTEDIVEHRAELFPELRFSNSAWDRLKSISISPHDLPYLILHHLGVLNDFACKVWADHQQSDQRIASMAAFGINCSPESPKTRGSKKIMRLRDFEFDSGTRRCEWHTKLEPHRGRIHFLVEDGRVYIGSVEEHIRTA